MSAYVIVDVDVRDWDTYQEYIKVAPESVKAYGGKFVARGGKAENLEGDWQPKRLVILEFESFERAKTWWASEEYRMPKELRQRASTANMIVVEGV